MKSQIIVIAIACALLPGAAAAGQAQGPQPGRGRQAAEGAPLTPGEVVNMLDAYAIVQAQDTLQLDDRQYGEFVTRLKKLQQTRRRNMQARHGLIQELRKLAGPQAPTPVDENAIRDRLKALADHEDRAAAEARKAYEALDEVLTPRQQARFRLLEEVLERRKIDLLKRAQQGAAARSRRQ